MSGSVSEHHFSQRDKKPREHPIVMKKRYQIGPGAAESLEIGWPEPSGNVSIFFSIYIVRSLELSMRQGSM